MDDRDTKGVYEHMLGKIVSAPVVLSMRVVRVVVIFSNE
jgi:hypothetical protein